MFVVSVLLPYRHLVSVASVLPAGKLGEEMPLWNMVVASRPTAFLESALPPASSSLNFVTSSNIPTMATKASCFDRRANASQLVIGSVSPATALQPVLYPVYRQMCILERYLHGFDGCGGDEKTMSVVRKTT